MGVIEESNSDWASPIVLVPKTDGSVRFCVNYRKVNAVSKFDAYPMPRVNELLDRLGTARFYSTLDLTKGYWQIPLSPVSKEKTAFTTDYTNSLRFRLACSGRRLLFSDSWTVFSGPMLHMPLPTWMTSSSIAAVFNSSPRAPPLCTFCMFLSSLQTFVLFDRKCPAKWTSQDIPPSFQFEASVYVPFKGH